MLKIYYKIYMVLFILPFSLFVLSSCGSGTGNDGNQIEVTVDTNIPPQIKNFKVSKTQGNAPLTVRFGWSLYDADGDNLTCKLDVNNDNSYEYFGNCDLSSPISYTYYSSGVYKVTLKVNDGEHEISESITIIVNDNKKKNTNLEEGLVAYWSFDNCDATDDSGNGYDGLINGSPKCVDGVKGKAFKFSGNLSDYISIKANKIVDKIVNSQDSEGFTISVFISMDKNYSYFFNPIIEATSVSRNYSAFHISADLDKSTISNCEFEASAGINWHNPFSENIHTCNIKPNEWYNLTFVFKEKEAKLYVNGRLLETYYSHQKYGYTDVTSYKQKSWLFENNLNSYKDDIVLYIGANPGGGWEASEGLIDEVRIYNRALSDYEIEKLYVETVNSKNNIDSLLIQKTILDTSFEEFSTGSLPNGFTIIYDGKGANYQSVVDDKAYTASKSLRIWGVSGWCANIDYDFNVFNYKKVEVSWKMYTTENNNGWISFINKDGDTWGWGWCGAGFSHKDGTYRICYTEENGNNTCEYVTNDKIPVKVNDWNDIKMVLNIQTTYCEVYLNGHKIYEATLDTNTGWANYKYYFLDGSTKAYKYLYKNPSAFYGLHGIRLGDCAGEDWDSTHPTYFDDLKIIGYIQKGVSNYNDDQKDTNIRGTYTGSYTTTSNPQDYCDPYGTISLSIDENGSISGIATTREGYKYTISGKIDLSSLNILAKGYGDDGEVKLIGKLENSSIIGTWRFSSYDGFMCSGDFSANANK